MEVGPLGLATAAVAAAPWRRRRRGAPAPRGQNSRAPSRTADVEARGKKRADDLLSRTSTCSRAPSCSSGAHDGDEMPAPITENDDTTISNPNVLKALRMSPGATARRQQHSPPKKLVRCTPLAPATTGLSVSPFPGLWAPNIVELSWEKSYQE